MISPIYTPFLGLFFAFQLKHSGLLNLPNTEELGQKLRVRIRGSEQDMRESGGLRTGRESSPAWLQGQHGDSDLKLIGQVSLCSARVDFDVVCGLLQFVVPLCLGHFDLAQVLSRHLFLLGFGLLFMQRSGRASE